MSMRDVERRIWKEAKVVLSNPKLRLKDIVEWSSSEKAVKGHLLETEVMIGIPSLGVWAAILRKHDKRVDEPAE